MGQVFAGREAELATIGRCVSAAAAGHPQVLRIVAGAGFGKTALVRQMVATLPANFVTLTADADELAAEQPFGVTAQLGVAAAASPFVAGLDLLALAGQRAGAEPLLILVEDLHWADAASRAALLTLARRLDNDGILLVVTSRSEPGFDDGWDRLGADETRCTTVILGPLSEQQVGDWAGRMAIGLTAAQAARLHRHTGGHPLYVKTLLSELTPEQLTAGSGELPAPRSLALSTLATLAGLPEESGRLAAALAVLGQRTPLATVARVGGVAQPTSALETLLATGLVRWAPGEVNTPLEFEHQLHRLAVYEDLSPTRRQALHRAAADCLGRSAGWLHRVAAADSVDDELADELDAGAATAVRVGAPETAATYLLWAAPLTTQRAAAEARLLRAARLLLADGRLERVRPLLADIQSCGEGPARELVLGSFAYETGDFASALRALAIAAESPAAEPGVRAAANARLSSIYVLQGEPHRQAQAAAAALSLNGDAETARAAWGSLAAAESSLNGAAAGLAVLARRLPDPVDDVDGADAELLMVRGLLRLYAAETRAGVADLRAAIRLSRDGAGHQYLPAAHAYLARALFITGDWDEAVVHARTAHNIAVDARHGWLAGRTEFILGAIAAARGHWQDAQTLLATVQRAAPGAGESAWAELLTRVLTAAIRRAERDPAGVVTALRPLADDARIVVARLAMITWWPILVEALIDTGDIDSATAQLEKLRCRAHETGMHIDGQLAGLTARLAAATGDPEAAARDFERAVTTIRPDDGVLDRGVLRHRYGRFLHACGNRRDAVTQLRMAHELFDGVGAEPYRDAVAADLAVCGIRAKGRLSGSPLELTEREQDVVALVRTGMTNKEIAAAIYVSEKAVEYHLRNVYGKLGIKSRRELRS